MLKSREQNFFIRYTHCNSTVLQKKRLNFTVFYIIEWNINKITHMKTRAARTRTFHTFFTDVCSGRPNTNQEAWSSGKISSSKEKKICCRMICFLCLKYVYIVIYDVNCSIKSTFILSHWTWKFYEATVIICCFL